jgi:hypothetical protein
MEASVIAINNENEGAAAMARIAPEAAALRREELKHVNLDLDQATDTILRLLPNLIALRERISKELPTFNLTQLDKLGDYVLALRFAHTAFQTASIPPEDVQELSEEALTLRARLVADAKALSLHNLLDSRKLDSLKGTKGMKNVAQDLEMLSRTLKESWPQIRGKSAFTTEDLDIAARMSARLAGTVAERAEGAARLGAAAERRQRVFTLTFRAYEEARSAVTYLRRQEGDADSITPNLYTGKQRRRPTSPVYPTDGGSQSQRSPLTSSQTTDLPRPPALERCSHAHSNGCPPQPSTPALPDAPRGNSLDPLATRANTRI